MAGLRTPRETEDTFADNPQVLARKIIVHKPSFRKDANQQLKAQYVHKLQDQYYAAMVHSALQSSPEKESFIWFRGHLVTMFRGCSRQSQSSASSASTSLSIKTNVSLIRGTEEKAVQELKTVLKARSICRRHILKACKIRTNNFKASLIQNYW